MEDIITGFGDLKYFLFVFAMSFGLGGYLIHFFFSNGLGVFKLMIIKNTTVIAKMKFDAHPQSDGGEGFFFVAGGLQCGTNSSKIVMN